MVRPGDTLRGLSLRYSGDIEKWRENWALNPDIKNPNFLTPGQRVQVLLSEDVPPQSARVVKVNREVQKKPSPQPWDLAQVDDMLREEDGIRTGRVGTMEMRFTDGTAMAVTEESLVFLRQVGGQLSGLARDEIEIVEGQADLAGRAVTTPTDIDIVIGPARAKPKPSADGTISTRLRKAPSGGAQLMVYEGESSVAAAGAEVEVGPGMGTSVEEGKPPAPPEPLLPAPGTLAPAAGTDFAFSNPEVAWQAVPKASSYTLEVCRDEDCLDPVFRQAGIEQAQFRPERLPVGDLFWRVRAVSGSGLDGYASPTLAFRVSADGPDSQPPEAELQLSGLYVRYGPALVLGPHSKLEIEAADSGAGLGEWRYVLDGEQVSKSSWFGPWKAGPHRAEAIVADKAGNLARLGPLEFVGDPDPPVLDWRTGGATMVDSGGLPGWQIEPMGRRRAKKLRKAGVILEYSSDGARWLPVPLPVQAGRWTAAEERVQVGQVLADNARVFLRALRANPFGGDSPVQLGEEGILEVRAEDTGSGVGQLSFGVANEAGGYQLWFEAIDLVGNRRTLGLPVVELETR